MYAPQPMRGYFIRADTPVCPYGKGNETKGNMYCRRDKDKRTEDNVGAHRCVPQKTEQRNNKKGTETLFCPFYPALQEMFVTSITLRRNRTLRN